MEDRIMKLISRVRLRLVFQRILSCLQVTVAVGLLGALGVSLVSLVVPFYYAPHVECGVIAASILAGIVWGVATAPDRRAAALAADSKGYQERISTALELIEEEKEKTNPYISLQMQDTLRAVQNFSVRKSFPLRVNLRFVAVWVVIAVAFVASLFADSLVRQRANELHAIKAQAADTVAQVEEVEKALKDSDEISESELAEYLEQLENSKSELTSASTSEDLLKAQERLEQKLKSVAEETSGTKLAEEAEKAASSTQSLASDTRQSLLEQAQEALEKAQNGTDEEKENAYEKLSELASALGDDTLAQAADNYQNSNYSSSSYAAAKSALAQAASDLSNSTLAGNNSNSSSTSTSSDASVSNSSGSSGDNSGSSSDNSGDGSSNSVDGTEDGSNSNGSSSNDSNSNSNGSNGSNGSSGTGTNSNGDSNGSNGDSNNGNSSNGSNGNGNSGGNGGSGSGNGGTGSNGGGTSGQGWNYGGNTGNEGNASSDESITVPDGEVGDDGNLTGQATDSDSSTYTQSDQAATWSGNKVSYGSVSAEYKEKAYAQVESSDYPDSLKEQIKNYFNELN